MIMSIFKAYDIRGIYPAELNEEMAYKIGKATAKHFNTVAIVVGNDARISTEPILKNFTSGILAMGVNVVYIGRVTTPIFYWSVAIGKYKAGAMITASHNPKEYNGMKFCKEGAYPVAEEEINIIRNLVENDSLTESPNKGTMTTQDIIPDYKNYILKHASGIKRKKVVIDTGNAVCGEIIPKVYNELDIEIIPLYFDVDPTFPNHQPDPLNLKNLKDLREKVVEVKADFGIALDGDGDRIAFIDEKGEVVAGDYVTLLIAISMIEEGVQNKTFLCDCRSSRIVKETLEKMGARVVLSRVGHSFIKKNMRKENVFFAGELSGHYYYQDNSYAENADVTLFRILKMISKKEKPLSEIVAPYRVYFHSGEINSLVADKDAKIKELEEIYSDAKISHIDGVTIEYNDWWCNVRPSNTEPLLRLNLEANTKKLMEEKRDEVLRIIRAGNIKKTA